MSYDHILTCVTPVLSGMGRAIATGPWRVNIATVTIVSASMGMDYRGMEGAVGGIENHNHYVRECIISSKLTCLRGKYKVNFSTTCFCLH